MTFKTDIKIEDMVKMKNSKISGKVVSVDNYPDGIFITFEDENGKIFGSYCEELEWL